jgi:tripartite-type tricarboxylate transporter receptor subunit TctC
MMMRRVLMFRLFAMAMASVCFSAAHAQSWPSKPVRIIVPFPPGGTTDIVARSLGVELQRMWQQPVIVENRAGAGGNVGAEAVARSPNDGYTVLMGTVGTHAINAALFAQSGNKMPFRQDTSRRCKGAGGAGSARAFRRTRRTARR